MHKVGDIFSWQGRQIKVIGGPNVIVGPSLTPTNVMWSVSLYTVRAGFYDFSIQTDRLIKIRAGATAVVRAYDLDVMIRYRQRNVIEAFCPNCDEPDMIFYSEDYICAWCREHLEDEVC